MRGTGLMCREQKPFQRQPGRSLRLVLLALVAHGLHAADGLLAVGAWDSVMLFDASERGFLRLLDMDGFVRSGLPPASSSIDSYGGVFGAGFVHLDGDKLVVTESRS